MIVLVCQLDVTNPTVIPNLCPMSAESLSETNFRLSRQRRISLSRTACRLQENVFGVGLVEARVARDETQRLFLPGFVPQPRLLGNRRIGWIQ